MYTLKLKLLETRPQIKKKILTALAEKLRPVMRTVAEQTKARVLAQLDDEIRNDPIVVELSTRGNLFGEIGVPDILMRIDSIVDIWKTKTEFIVKDVVVSKGGIVGGFTLKVINYNDALLSNDSVFLASSKDGGYHYLPWLRWLLFNDDQDIVYDYDFYAKEGYGRTTKGVMIANSGRGYWEPPISDDENDNFVERTVNKIALQIPNYVNAAFQKVL